MNGLWVDGNFVLASTIEAILSHNTQQEFRIKQLESKLKEASELIQKLGPTIDWDIVSEIEEMLR